MVEQNRAYLALLNPTVAVAVFVIDIYFYQWGLLGVARAADVFYTDR